MMSWVLWHPKLNVLLRRCMSQSLHLYYDRSIYLVNMNLLAIDGSLNLVTEVYHMNLLDVGVKLEEFDSMIRPNPEV